MRMSRADPDSVLISSHSNVYLPMVYITQTHLVYSLVHSVINDGMTERKQILEFKSYMT